MPHYHIGKFKCAACSKEQQFFVLCGTQVIPAETVGPACMFCGKKELVCLTYGKEPHHPISVPSYVQVPPEKTP